MELHSLGLPNELHIGAATQGEYTLDRYNDRMYTINSGLDYL